MAEESPELASLLGRNIDDPLLDISTYALNLLYNLPGTRTIGNLIKFSSQDLRRIPRFGPNSLAEVENALAKLGLKLAPVDYKSRI